MEHGQDTRRSSEPERNMDKSKGKKEEIPSTKKERRVTETEIEKREQDVDKDKGIDKVVEQGKEKETVTERGADIPKLTISYSTSPPQSSTEINSNNNSMSTASSSLLPPSASVSGLLRSPSSNSRLPTRHSSPLWTSASGTIPSVTPRDAAHQRHKSAELRPFSTYSGSLIFGHAQQSPGPQQTTHGQKKSKGDIFRCTFFVREQISLVTVECLNLHLLAPHISPTIVIENFESVPKETQLALLDVRIPFDFSVFCYLRSLLCLVLSVLCCSPSLPLMCM